MGRMPCEGVAKSVPHLKTQPFICLAFSCQNMKRLRNRIVSKFMIYMDKIVDCKSAHAGSIPASASTFESPADSRLRGFFMTAEKGGCVPHFWKASACRYRRREAKWGGRVFLGANTECLFLFCERKITTPLLNQAACYRLVYKVIDVRIIVSVITVGKRERSAVYNQAKKR